MVGTPAKSAVGAKRVAVVAAWIQPYRRGPGGLKSTGCRRDLVDDARKARPTCSQGGQHSGQEYDGSAKFHGLALSVRRSTRIGREKCVEQRQHLVAIEVARQTGWRTSSPSAASGPPGPGCC